jgi:tetratricopeptide (TPR) repeat protein
MPDNDPPAKKDFFISYNKADRAWAEWVAWHLEESGHYEVDIQAWDFGPGCNFVLEMDRAIQRCDRVVAVLSPDYLTSLFTKPEWAAYFVQDPTGEERRFISVRVRECEPKGLLTAVVYADLVGKPDNDAKAALLDAVKKGRRKPDSAPSFPGRKIIHKPRFPGAIPDIWNVPHLRNPNFTEPGQRLIEMRDALRSGKPAALTQALAGLGGVGKTQLAIEYAYRYATDYSLVWWVRSEQVATLASEFATLATALDLPEKNAAEQPVIVAAVRDALQHRRDWLLVFDNANGPEEIREYLPGMGGHILITSRHAAWGGVAEKVEVKKWTPEVASEFLLKRTGQTDADAAKELAYELDYLPLALEQAAAYIDSAHKELRGYLAMFREHHLALLKRGRPSTDYPATVATTWDLSFQQLEMVSPGASALLQVCAFLAPDDIPRDVIASHTKHLPELLRETVGDGLAFDEAVSAIRRYSLMDAIGESALSMHRLVQAVVRDRLALPDRQGWTACALGMISTAFPADSNEVRNWHECSRLRPHAIAVVAAAEDLGIALLDAATLLNRMAVYAHGRAEYAEAKAVSQRASGIAERALGPDNPTTAIALSNLGSALHELGEVREAKEALERALTMKERLFGSGDAESASTLNNLSVVLQEMGDGRGAKAALERALRIDEANLGRAHPTVGIRLINLAGALTELGDLPGAYVASQRALEIAEKALDSDHPQIAAAANALGNVFQDLGKLQDARAAFERALKIEERAFGSHDPRVGIALSNLGGVLGELGDLAGARAAAERALEILRTSLGEAHPKTHQARKNLSLVRF